MTIQEIEQKAKEGNINAVDAFFQSGEAKDYDRVTIWFIKELLMDAIVRDYVDRDGDMDEYFYYIWRVANMKVR